MNKNKKSEKIFNLIKEYSEIWKTQLMLEFKYKEKNVCNAFKGVGAFGEMITTFYEEDFFGCGSGGLGKDLINNNNKEIEVKTSVTIQPNKCCHCNFKFSSLFDECTICKSKKYKIVKDSRFGINAKNFLESHEKGNIKGFYVYHLHNSKKIDREKCEMKLAIDCYKILFEYNDSKIEQKKIQYFKNQRDKSEKSNCCNLLPCSYDFYLLNPKFFDSWEIIINYKEKDVKNIIKNTWDENKEKILVPIKVTNNKPIEKNKFLKLSGNKKFLALEKFIENFDFKKKTFNKDRGSIKEYKI